MSNDTTLSRRGLLTNLGMLLNGCVAAALAIPAIQFLLSSLTHGCANGRVDWVTLGPIDQFPEGETKLATFWDRLADPTENKTVNAACWVRHIKGEQFQVFAVNCVHLGCPVRWFRQSGLFICPCHGGSYYRDGSRASGPPGRGLHEYPYKIDNGLITIQTGEITIPGVGASLMRKAQRCA